MENNILFAFSVTLFAGLATGIGGLIAFFIKRDNTRFLSVALGFSAGVMIYVSFVEIFPKAQESLVVQLGESMGSWITALSFFAGMLLIAIIDKLVPSQENPHEIITEQEAMQIKSTIASIKDRDKLLRMGILTALAISIHNFPEGFATFMASLKDPALGVSIGIAIAIHNIPEGIAVSMPVYYATGSRKKAFVYSFLSGLTEPLGAILGYLILVQFMTDAVFGITFAAVGGIMVFISFDQLLPTAEEYGAHHLSIYGLVAGMLVMAVSLLLFL